MAIQSIDLKEISISYVNVLLCIFTEKYIIFPNKQNDTICFVTVTLLWTQECPHSKVRSSPALLLFQHSQLQPPDCLTLSCIICSSAVLYYLRSHWSLLSLSNRDLTKSFLFDQIMCLQCWMIFISDLWKSYLPELDTASPLHLHYPFTSSICWVTLQGYVTLSSLNDASTCYQQENYNYLYLYPLNVYLSQWHWAFWLLQAKPHNLTCCVRGQIIPKKKRKKKYTYMCVCVWGGDSDGSDYHHHAAINAVKKKKDEILKPCWIDVDQSSLREWGCLEF